MTDDKNKLHSDDEYQFPHDEYVTPQDEQASATQTTGVDFGGDASGAQPDVMSKIGAAVRGLLGRFSEIKNKRIVIIIAVVIIGIIALHFLREPKTTQPVQQTAVTQPAPVVQPVQALQSQSTFNTLAPAEPDQSAAKIHDLEAQITDMQNSLSQAQAQNQQLQQSVTELTERVQNLSSDIDKLLTAKSAPKVKKMVYHLRAVVPDRAWITSPSGDTTSVTVGDHVNDYGTVQSIDSVKGVIQTSSGRKIEYGVNDY